LTSTLSANTDALLQKLRQFGSYTSSTRCGLSWLESPPVCRPGYTANHLVRLGLVYRLVVVSGQRSTTSEEGSRSTTKLSHWAPSQFLSTTSDSSTSLSGPTAAGRTPPPPAENVVDQVFPPDCSWGI
jgi:hypothetical protein